jgi:hypothetical protein
VVVVINYNFVGQKRNFFLGTSEDLSMLEIKNKSMEINLAIQEQ